METLKFKTNIKCGGCIATVTPFLNEQKEISTWAVDTDTPEKILTVEGDVSPETVMNTLGKAGFKAEKI
ncbi:heavy-metal-associated domain-containing protein [Pedobacter immunditicola]|uniref:heavy-metal-associated domain-containing protein n=1 Tax=Pedobacter immunditicola TaxID=3133440 RepID=UPI0030983EE0